MQQDVQVARRLGVRVLAERRGVDRRRVLQPHLHPGGDRPEDHAGLVLALLVDEGERAPVGRHQGPQLGEQQVGVVAAGDPGDGQVGRPVRIAVQVHVVVVGRQPVGRELPLGEDGGLG